MTAGPLPTLPASRSAWIWPYLQPVAHLHKRTGWVEGPCATGQQVGTVVSMQQLHEVHALSSDVLPCPVALLSPFHRGRPGQLWEIGARGGGAGQGLQMLSVLRMFTQGPHPPGALQATFP